MQRNRRWSSPECQVNTIQDVLQLAGDYLISDVTEKVTDFRFSKGSLDDLLRRTVRRKVEEGTSRD